MHDVEGEKAVWQWVAQKRRTWRRKTTLTARANVRTEHDGWRRRLETCDRGEWVDRSGGGRLCDKRRRATTGQRSTRNAVRLRVRHSALFALVQIAHALRIGLLFGRVFGQHEPTQLISGGLSALDCLAIAQHSVNGIFDSYSSVQIHNNL